MFEFGLETPGCCQLDNMTNWKKKNFSFGGRGEGKAGTKKINLLMRHEPSFSTHT